MTNIHPPTTTDNAFTPILNSPPCCSHYRRRFFTTNTATSLPATRRNALDALSTTAKHLLANATYSASCSFTDGIIAVACTLTPLPAYNHRYLHLQVAVIVPTHTYLCLSPAASCLLQGHHGGGGSTHICRTSLNCSFPRHRLLRPTTAAAAASPLRYPDSLNYGVYSPSLFPNCC